MAHKVLPKICLGDEAAEGNGIVLPSFTFAPFAGRTPLDEVSTDLVLMTKLYRHDIPAALHISEPSVAELLKSIIGEEFAGKRGEVNLVQSSLPNSQGEAGRYFLLYGLGPEQSYGSRTTCALFETFFKQALELGVAHVVVPFIPNPMTKNSMTHRATAFKLKHVLRQVLADWQGPVALREVMMYCTPAAVRHIQAGLSIEPGEGHGCPCEGNHRR
jgi:hypothetical protein